MSIKINNKENKTYIVLGAPHSATSFISKALQNSGVNMSRPYWKDTGRFKHHYEDRGFWQLNRRILRSIPGRSWNNLPTENEILETDFKKQIKKLINKRKNKLWGWKDPRTSITIKKYLPYLEGDIYLICCFRKPEKTIKSLKRKYKNTVSKNLVDKYNKSIISAIKEFCEL